MSSYRVFSPIESFCVVWPQARFVVTSMLPDEIEFESHPGSGLVSMCTDFVRPILEAVPTQHPMIARELGERFTWIAKCMPMTLPTPVELQHFNGMRITPSLMMRVRPRDTSSASRDPVCDVSPDHDATVPSWTRYRQVPSPDRPRLVVAVLNTTKPRRAPCSTGLFFFCRFRCLKPTKICEIWPFLLVLGKNHENTCKKRAFW
jgi:hypothetical protein